ncbi:undecaprenyl-diphosphate phosphatase [Dictyobacter aurantiacus]|uniref:Undecaprenyl-diphosphatase n=1 Tax=Dictyobacter aurantiacus TaxID=1936993 RepID=A0A401ZC06_9CHLR|nr:undecaprenyl-diphosphate phosphatase [Dictyobacter aurantiacus]GCE04395.1 undecaprenyl-diphosphatase [Dictyobacter aurantiacus]
MDLMQIIKTVVLALLQGVTELFPISSLGHTVIIPSLVGWGDLAGGTACGGKSCFLPVVVALHLGTSLALLIYFWRDWLQVLKTIGNVAVTRKITRGTEEWVSWLIILGTIPAGLLGLLLKNKLENLFSEPQIVAAVLFLNGSVLFIGEAMRRRAEANLASLPPREREAHFRSLKTLSIKEALLVGLAQSLALIPGFSRSGTTIVAGLGVRLTHEDAARYSFLLGTPVILAASALEVPVLFHQSQFPFWLIILGMVISGVAAYLSTAFLTRYFEKGRLDPFAYYCWAAGLITLVLFAFVLHV